MRSKIEQLLSEKQRQALSLEQGGALIAGAGAGKTRTLVSMIVLDLVVNNIAPEDLLVCTFTRAAAANLVIKLQSELEAHGFKNSELVTRAWVGTIDSNASRLVREHALALGISPAFSIIQGGQLSRLQRLAIKRALNRMDPADIVAISQIINLVDEQKKSDIVRIYDTLRMADALQQSPAITTLADVETARNELLEKLDEAKNAPRAGGAVTNKLNILKELAHDDDILTLQSKKKVGNTEANDIFHPALEHFISVWTNMRTAEIRVKLLKFINLFDKELRALKKRSQVLDFTDVTLLAKKLVESGANTKKFARVYVDEAQDTSPVQQDFLEALGDIIIVGDEAQSVYGFRNADVRGFRRQRSQAARTVSLDDNYRSDPRIIQTVNAMTAATPGLQSQALRMSAQKTAYDRRITTSIHVRTQKLDVDFIKHIIEHEMSFPGRKLGDICFLGFTNNHCAEYVSLLQQAGYASQLKSKKSIYQSEVVKDMVAYMQLLHNTRDDEAFLRVATSPYAGATFIELEELSIQQRPERARRREGKDVEVPSLFELYTNEDFKEIFRRHQKMMNYTAPHRIVELAHEAHHYEDVIKEFDPTGAKHEQVVHFVATLKEMERSYNGSHFGTILKIIEDDIKHKEDGGGVSVNAQADAVQVMTVHAAKGDEFPVVILPHLEANVRNHSDSLLVNRNGEIGIELTPYGSDTLHQAIKSEKKLDAEEEYKRVWYVGMTRAMESLHMVTKLSVNKDQTLGRMGAITPHLRKYLDSTDETIWQNITRSCCEFATDDSRFTVDETLSGSGVAIYAWSRAAAVEEEVSEINQPEWAVFRKPVDLEYTHYSKQPQTSFNKAYSSFTEAQSNASPLIDLRAQLQAEELESSQELVRNGRLYGSFIHNRINKCLTQGRSVFSAGNVPEIFDQEQVERTLSVAGQIYQGYLDKGYQPLSHEEHVTYEYNGNIIHCVLDLVVHKDGEIVVVDWKTGIENEIDYSLQQTLYALAASKRWQPQKIVTAWLYLDDLSRSQQQVFETREDIINALEGNS